MKCFQILLGLLISLTSINAKYKYDKNAEYYSTSVESLLKLIKLEEEFMLILQDFEVELQNKIETLKIYYKTINRVALASHIEREEHVSNPLNTFAIIRRVIEDWRTLQSYTRSQEKDVQVSAMRQLLAKKPNLFDMNNAIMGIDRLMKTYDLDAFELSQGRVQGKQFNTKLSMRDCLAIANHKYANEDYENALIWYYIVLKYEPENNSEAYNQVYRKPLEGVRRKLARSSLIQAVGIADPSPSLKETVEKVDKILAETNSIEQEDYVRLVLKQDYNQLLQTLIKPKSQPSTYFLGCRGQFPKRTNLHCGYIFTTTPFLRIAPLKLEEVHLDPYIVVYHNVLYDSEIEEMKRLSDNMFNAFSSDLPEKSTEFMGSVQWLTETSPLRERLNERIQDIAGFTVDDSPALQVANYGIGSNYFDAETKLSDRFASLIFYAGEVTQGGTTVFPQIQVAHQPQKGSALFWFNQFVDGVHDPRTLHSVCPVMLGSQWTLTKWIHITL